MNCWKGTSGLRSISTPFRSSIRTEWSWMTVSLLEEETALKKNRMPRNSITTLVMTIPTAVASVIFKKSFICSNRFLG